MNQVIQGVVEWAKRKIPLPSSLMTVSHSDAATLTRTVIGAVYGRRYTSYLLLKLDFIYTTITPIAWLFETPSVEHILPQTPKEDSQWCIDFNVEQERIR